MDTSTYVIMVDLPLLILGLGVVFAVVWNKNGVGVLGRHSHHFNTRVLGMSAMLGVWLLLTIASLGLGFLGGMLLLYLVLFSLGRAAAWIATVLILAFLASIPFLWGWALLRPAVWR